MNRTTEKQMEKVYKRVYAPWDMHQVVNLINRQEDETRHPYTCPMCSKKLDPHVYGWCCKVHGLIKRSWAHEQDTRSD